MEGKNLMTNALVCKILRKFRYCAGFRSLYIQSAVSMHSKKTRKTKMREEKKISKSCMAMNIWKMGPPMMPTGDQRI